MKKFILTIICLILAVIFCFSGIKTEVLAYQFDDMSAKSYIVIDGSGNILLSKNPNE